MTEPAKYTPEKIVIENNISFSIPLYQRLFEWDKTQIEQLLSDLYSSFEKDKDRPYYIGMLTVVEQEKGNKFDLVDGQQRYTVLMLMGVAFGWYEFVKKKDNNLRLTFFARKNDEDYLENLIVRQTNGGYVNKHMQEALQIINAFADKKTDKSDFIDFIYTKTTFFISFLPDGYKLHDLNRYYEAMNATGRGLENHEILKVDLLKRLDGKKEYYTRIWNAISDMDKLLIRQRGDENVEQYRNRQHMALTVIQKTDELAGHCIKSDAKNNNTDGGTHQLSIRDINASSNSPEKVLRALGERAALSFPDFLLLVLGLQLGETERKQIPEFYNVHHLQRTFKEGLKDNSKVEAFFCNLLKYRILFDHFIIRLSSNSDDSKAYTLQFKEDAPADNTREKLIQYQSMLYVSTTTHIWLNPILEFLEKNNTDGIAELLDTFKIFDNDRQAKTDGVSLRYGQIDRYWFWRLDYYLWEKELLKDNANKQNAILDYTFRTNRSIEHLHPQHPKNAEDAWSPTDLNSFGNLAMISSGFNSTQGHDYDQVKFARIKAQKDGKYPLESIKMCYMYEMAKENINLWTKELAREHGDEMIQLLIDSFPDPDKYKNIRGSLFAQLSDDNKNEMKDINEKF